MQTLTRKVFSLAPPGGLFDETVVANLFPAHSVGARKQLVHRAVSHAEVVRLKPGLFCLAAQFRRSHPHPFVVASMLHWPCHVSLESALSFHGLIPEAVHTISCVTVRRSRSFTNELGRFSYVRVPANEPRAGVTAVQMDESGWAFIAVPIRAIADLVYLRKEVQWHRHGIGFLTESMRIDEADLEQIKLDELDLVCDSIRDRRTRSYLKGLHRTLRP